MTAEATTAAPRLRGGERTDQRLEITSGELLPGEPIPLLKKRKELSRKEALKLWSELRQKGWQACSPQW